MGRLGRNLFDYPNSESQKAYLRLANFFKHLDSTAKKFPWFTSVFFNLMLVEVKYCANVDEGLNQEEKRRIINRANQILQYCEISEGQDSGIDESLSDLESVDTLTDLLGHLYAIFELNLLERFPAHPYSDPFWWNSHAEYCMFYEKGKNRKKVGRKKNSEHPEKMLIVEKVIQDFPRAPDKRLSIEIALRAQVHPNTASNWLKAYREKQANKNE